MGLVSSTACLHHCGGDSRRIQRSPVILSYTVGSGQARDTRCPVSKIKTTQLIVSKHVQMSVSVLISEQGDFKTKSINTDTDGIFHKSERTDSKQIHAEVHEISV